MNYLRQKVSGKKKRLVQGEYDLDLTYVTQRIVAMSLPGEGFESFYRNPIDKVASYLNKQHRDSYFIFNLSGKTYDETKFHGEIFKDYIWKDHHSPSLNILFDICLQIHNILKANNENVVVVHCLAGKGRTGTVICCYLLYTGKFNSVQDVLYYYGKKRFSKEGLGVNQPCQVKYIKYFYELLTMNYRIYPTVVQIKRIQFYGQAPKFNMNGSCKPFVQIIDVKSDMVKYSTEQDSLKYKGNTHQIVFKQIMPIYGDILIKVNNQGVLKNQKMFRFAFNTAFFEATSKMNFTLDELDPSQVLDDDRFDQLFTVQIEVEQCKKCNNRSNFAQKCESCKSFLSHQENGWNRINEIITRYQKPKDEQVVQLLFLNKENDDVELVLKNGKFRNNSVNFSQEDFLQQQF